ncbi:hypothetical protein [Streptomyces sp. IB2014 016-6]|uniref:hypothetical protein n=1 Tax=Streptomyces sp. IB2014 016-6 TaxID=2517818 RepID=UPI0011C7501A|nr:hypothetical protein [Streptomyces sp. IB2014 016-6]TXL83889.1 hypothetical protein EW053_36175 [Streptomyces sp. IB2014 016-6]
MIPGVSQLLGLRNPHWQGPRTALLAAGGRLVAFAVMMVLVGVGSGTLLHLGGGNPAVVVAPGTGAADDATTHNTRWWVDNCGLPSAALQLL